MRERDTYQLRRKQDHRTGALRDDTVLRRGNIKVTQTQVVLLWSTIGSISKTQGHEKHRRTPRGRFFDEKHGITVTVECGNTINLKENLGNPGEGRRLLLLLGVGIVGAVLNALVSFIVHPWAVENLLVNSV